MDAICHRYITIFVIVFVYLVVVLGVDEALAPAGRWHKYKLCGKKPLSPLIVVVYSDKINVLQAT